MIWVLESHRAFLLTTPPVYRTMNFSNYRKANMKLIELTRILQSKRPDEPASDQGLECDVQGELH